MASSLYPNSCAWAQMLPVTQVWRWCDHSILLWQILSVYIVCQCDLDLRPIFPKIDPEGVMYIYAYLEVNGRLRIW